MINWVNLAFALGTGVPMGLWVSKNLFDTEYKIKKATTKGLKYLFEERNIINKSGSYPFVEKIEVHSWGVKALIDIKKVCSFEEFQKIKDNINTYFGSLKVDMVDRRGKVEINIINILIEQGDFLNYRYVPLSPYQLLLGYGDDKELLIADMKSRPHVLITGLSEQGKTGMVKCITTNLIPNADVIVCNSFRDDFAKIKGVRYVKGTKDTLTFLNNIHKDIYRRERPLYIVLEELATLRDKKTIDTIYELLCVARHYNVYVIGIVQESLKSEFKFKSLFNTRISFSMPDGYVSSLGVDYTGELAKREFVWRSEKGLIKGHTFTIE